MDWHHKTELGFPVTAGPSKSGWSSLEYREPPKMIDWDAYVKWQWGERYGLITRNKAGSWKVTRFLAQDVSIKEHGIILGNSEAFFDLKKGKLKDLPEERIRELKLHEFPFRE